MKKLKALITGASSGIGKRLLYERLYYATHHTIVGINKSKFLHLFISLLYLCVIKKNTAYEISFCSTR